MDACGRTDAAQVDAAQVDAAELDAAQVDAAQVDAAEPMRRTECGRTGAVGNKMITGSRTTTGKM